MSVYIRKADKSDVPDLLNLIAALADYENLPRPSSQACRRLAVDGWPDSGEPRFTAWLAEIDAGASAPSPADRPRQRLKIGYAITFYTYSSFRARPTLYIEDIFVLPEHRRQSAGTAMLQRLTEEAVSHGCGRIDWVVLDWNTSAQAFYQKYGAEHLSEWHCYRINLEEPPMSDS